MIHRFTISKTAFLHQRKAVSLIEKGRFAPSALKVHIHSNTFFENSMLGLAKSAGYYSQCGYYSFLIREYLVVSLRQ